MATTNMPDVIKKRETVGTYVFGTAIILALVGVLYQAIPYAINLFSMIETLAWRLITAGVSLTIATLLVMNVKNFWLLMRIATRKLTNFCVAIFPIDVMEERIQQAKVKFAVLTTKYETVVKVHETLKHQVETLEAEHEELKRQIRVLGADADPLDKRRVAQQLRRNEDSLRQRRKQLGDMDLLKAAIQKTRKICEFFIDDLSEAKETYKSNWEAAKATQSVVAGVRDVFSTIGEGNEEWAGAAWAVDDASAQGLADLEVLMQDLDGSIRDQEIKDRSAVLRIDDLFQQQLNNRTGVRVDANTAPSNSASTPSAVSIRLDDDFHSADAGAHHHGGAHGTGSDKH